jgi:Domain of Unknown Function with PDB structure (DUF3857)/Transglutaminase-like superfamily
MKVAISGLILTISTTTSAAFGQAAKVEEGASPKWALTSPVYPETIPPKDALIQVRFLDNQLRISKKGQEAFVAQRFKILRPEALQAANLNFAWRPSSGSLMVHSVRLHRKDGSTEEMLGKATFRIVQREENLEQSILTGLTTAVFAIPGVDVGDEVEFSATISGRDPTLGEMAFGTLQLPLIEIGGAYRARLIQSDGAQLSRKTTPDLDIPAYTTTKTPDELLVRIDNPKSINLPQGAPGRFGIGRLIEYSSFTDWSDVSTTFWKHFDRASKLTKDSPVRSEITKIVASTTDPEARALAALKLVQDRVRYVYVGFGTGNYTPATADQTWDRRYGDCKGKTALLLAILNELGVPAEAVLVNQGGLDGTSNRLASPGHFDHVLVRIKIGSRSHWLDGTQFNSPKLEYMYQPSFRTALPLRAKGAVLESVIATPLLSPELLEIVEIDASAGRDKPARINVSRVLHGNGINELRAGLASMAGDDLKRALSGLLEFGTSETENEVSSWSFDENTGALSLKWAGSQKLDWEGEGPTESWLFLPGAGFTPPVKLKRAKEQDQTVPWAVSFPDFRCWITTLRLPADSGRLRWTYSAKPVDRKLGGIHYFRQATIQKGTVQTVMSKRSVQAELTAAEANEIESALPNFNSEQSYVYKRMVGRDAGNTDDARPVKDTTSIDWLSGGKICQPAIGK